MTSLTLNTHSMLVESLSNANVEAIVIQHHFQNLLQKKFKKTNFCLAVVVGQSALTDSVRGRPHGRLRLTPAFFFCTCTVKEFFYVTPLQLVFCMFSTKINLY